MRADRLSLRANAMREHLREERRPNPEGTVQVIQPLAAIRGNRYAMRRGMCDGQDVARVIIVASALIYPSPKGGNLFGEVQPQPIPGSRSGTERDGRCADSVRFGNRRTARDWASITAVR